MGLSLVSSQSFKQPEGLENYPELHIQGDFFGDYAYGEVLPEVMYEASKLLREKAEKNRITYVFGVVYEYEEIEQGYRCFARGTGYKSLDD
jgi:hypothetical protein